ncbi:hypothetical protein NP493_1500g00003 [Ridgeia piscesae]|uniref:Uncharacterized protein n=1 Tax=Ridgeia piscesae TaxID=27915 RepID=A0AAD9K1P0_RIDPI|nr:hypothetical protein NP493_1500g00003 [Ridgeia piscesae]
MINEMDKMEQKWKQKPRTNDIEENYKGRAELEPVQISRSNPWCTKMAFLFGFAKKQTEITCFLAKPDECLQL